MLAAVLNICTQEELNETAQESTSSAVVVDRDRAERRKVIKNKILAVGRISHMFSVLRYATVYCYRTAPLTFFSNSEESERVSELKSISGSTRLPYGTLALGAEGIKNAIKSFDDACVPSLIFYPFVLAVLNIGLFRRRKSDIDNERLPPVEERPPPTSSASPSPSIIGTGSSTSSNVGTGAGVGVGTSIGTTNTARSMASATLRRKEGRLSSAQRR
jgi:serine/threonine-protein phosphatase 2B catalytic subunit